MNSQYPIPSSAFSFNPLNPNPNFSNPQFSSWAPPPPPPPPSLPPPASLSQSQSQPQPHLPDLSSSLSSLENLLQLSNSTLQSFSSLLPPLSRPSNSLIQCPSNPHHWVPPSSLFLHSLHCPSSLDLGTLLDSLQYPKTLNSGQHLIHQNKFVQPLNDPTSELCFSLDDYVDFGSNFFYQGCPGVVSSTNDDATRRIFTLPGVLLVECANFVGSSDRKNGVLEGCVKMLPSEIWIAGREFEQWSEYPIEYSYSILRAFKCMEILKESELLSWLIANSPRFGVVIDVAVRDHMSVLFRLCLKAMMREAALSHGSLFKSNVDEIDCKLDVKFLRFKCPGALEALRWLAAQLSILYGDINAKSFVIAMLRHLLLSAASYSSTFPLDNKQKQATAVVPIEHDERDDKTDDRTDESISSKSIFVYQIAAAIAALHERSLLEERIRALRNPLPLTAYQRMAEHQYISKKADEERQKRPDYRPLIEHDSLPSQRQHDQETNKFKTREELLAEERDYKRRRMSYRGKKLKRTTKEVIRDLIEEYMEAINQTGGIGGVEKGDAEGVASTSKNSSVRNSTNLEMKYHLQNDQQDGYKKFMDYDYDPRDKKPIDASPSRKGKESYNHRDIKDQRTIRDRYSRDYHSRSPSRDRRRSRSREHRSHRRNQGNMVKDENECYKSKYSIANMSGYNDKKSLYTTSSSLRSSSGRKDKRELESPDRYKRKKHDDKWGSFGGGGFSDRYDPSEARDIYDDQFIDGQSTND